MLEVDQSDVQLLVDETTVTSSIYGDPVDTG
jgi:hypothetical protein